MQKLTDKNGCLINKDRRGKKFLMKKFNISGKRLAKMMKRMRREQKELNTGSEK